MSSRLARERRTVEAMLELYCRGRHRQSGLCPDCAALREYALARLEKCKFGEAKPTCANCPVHCYQPEMRAKIKQVMRYSGPRMLYRHPVLAFCHLLDGRKKVNTAK
jgi:hypothetical protein